MTKQADGAMGERMRGWLAALIVLAGCAGAPASPPRTDHVDDRDGARTLVTEARQRIERGRYDEARERLNRARALADPKTLRIIAELGAEIDALEAESIGVAARRAAEQGRCEEALVIMASHVTNRSPGVLSLLRQRTAAASHACVVRLLQAGQRSRARAIVTGDAIAAATDAPTRARIEASVDEAVEAALARRVASPMQARQFEAVAAALDDAVAKGEASSANRERLLGAVRQGVTQDVERLVGEAFGRPGATAALAKLDALLAAGRWQPSASSKAPPGPLVEAIPAETARLARELRFWGGCEAVRCVAVSPVRMWTYGRPALHDAEQPTSSSSRALAHGREVWKIAEGLGVTFVSMEVPAALDTLAARAHTGGVWVKSIELRAQDTSQWLPPGAAIVGTRVWGALRDGVVEYELGVATGVSSDGLRVEVKRVGDDVVVTLPRSKLHFGSTRQGTMVLALCGGIRLSRARIERIQEQPGSGSPLPSVALQCLDGEGSVVRDYQESLGAIRTKREWLGPQR